MRKGQKGKTFEKDIKGCCGIKIWGPKILTQDSKKKKSEQLWLGGKKATKFCGVNGS